MTLLKLKEPDRKLYTKLYASADDFGSHGTGPNIFKRKDTSGSRGRVGKFIYASPPM